MSGEKFENLMKIMYKLRKECPWDKEQTHDSIKSASIEEVYELVEAIDEKEIIQHCINNLAKFKVPSSVQFIEALPRNATGKVLKRNLREDLIGSDAPAIS